jgi:hypothetical protein
MAKIRPTVTTPPLPWLKHTPTYSNEASANKHFPPIADEREQMQSIRKVAANGGAPSKLRGK